IAQAPSAVIKKATVAPVIDGTVDDVWATADPNLIDKPFTGETPTLGASGDTWWKALWDDKGIYVLVNVKDDVWAPFYASTDIPGNSYKFDKVEVYFDTNFNLQDGKGPLTDGNGLGDGHYQFAPNPIKDSISGGKALKTGGNGSSYSFNVTDPTYMVEFFIPFTKLIDDQGVMVDKTGTIGFDITVSDNDVPSPGLGTRNRAVWANTNAGGKGESWNNMDDCGTITLDGATNGITVDKITIAPTDGKITTDKGTLQMTATILPVDATNQILKWSIEDVPGTTAQATISSTGLLTAATNGNVVIKAVSTDGSFTESQTVTVTITGQVKIKYSDVVWNTSNIIKNWNFTDGVTSWGNYVDAAVAGQVAPVVTDGVAILKAGLATDNQPWHYQFNQPDLTAEPNVPYTVMFKSWSSAKAACVLDFESASAITPANGGDQYNRYGASTDPEAVNKRSEWNYTTTTLPSWFTFHVTFDEIIPTTIQKIQWMISLSNETIHLDSVLVVKTSDLGTVGTKSIANSINKVYPSPVGNGNTLYVELSSVKTNVAIYNAVGQKMMEKVVTGNLAKFDVSSLQKGMYFVKLSDG
ncbi:MAG TPA: hypothetical protein DCL77_09365, partial [Prolixibacteraceae bacterium]|nr:hypothetical protein [Prolixibacteraceae bacterium]